MKRKRRELGLVELFVVRSGTSTGEAINEAAFPTKDLAVQFLVALHGLDKEETSSLRKTLKLKLQPKVHGAEQCLIHLTAMPEAEASRALSGELYLKDAPTLLTPRKLRAKKTDLKKKR
jgi:hypothetical protein